MSSNNTSAITLENLSKYLKDQFPSYAPIQGINIWSNKVVYVDLNNKEDLFIGIDCYTDGTIELVFRTDYARLSFSRYFSYFFKKKTMIFEKGICINPHFYNPIFSDEISLASIAEKVSFIIKCFFDVENSISLKQLLEKQILNNVMLDMATTMQPKLLSMLDTVKKIRDEKLSIARFGDGELTNMLTTKTSPFQKHNYKLMRELQEILSEQNDLLVCFPNPMVHHPYWDRIWSKYWAKCKIYLKKDIYGDSLISRPEAFTMYGKEMVRIWKDMWNGKRVCFITGEGSRLNAQHIIFNNIIESQHIYSKKYDAYDDIDNIVEKCKLLENVDMFLIALGMTGTVLAYRLYKLGYRALDIGHLNNSYDNVFNNAPVPEAQ